MPTSSLTLPSLVAWFEGAKGGNIKYNRIKKIDTTNKTITFRVYFSNLSLTDAKILILKSKKIASGNYSHAEGSTSSPGVYSHAEGFISVSDQYGHAEGFRNIAGDSSHAEGSNTIARRYSHSEGTWTIASGSYSHVEGYQTIAQREANHVFGEYNLPDDYGDSATKGNYIEIVGNGTADDARSNARTLDWNGNEVLAGKLTVGADPTNNMDVATKQYVDDNAGGDATITMTNNIITLTNASGQTSSITLPVYSGAVSGGAS